MKIESLKARLARGDVMASTFVKIPDVTTIEVLAQSELDFVILDAEHSAIDWARADACFAVARALDFPVLVRVRSGSAENILGALDAGAVGVVVPHVDSVEKAQAIARAAHFGEGGRGFAGSTRWADYATHPMETVLKRDAQTIVIAQIEEPAGVDCAEHIAAVDGIDGLFAGPADLTVAYGHDTLDNPALQSALSTIGAACAAQNKCYFSFVGTSEQAAQWRKAYGMNAFVVASDQSFMRQSAVAVARGVHAITGA